MKIYTKTGDSGETALYGGKRVSKANLRVNAYGTVDEANSYIGLIRSFNNHDDIDLILANIQNTLFDLGADLATPHSAKSRGNIAEIDEDDITRLENSIDNLELGLEPLQRFILPGGSPVSATAQIARTITRRAEREAVALAEQEEINPACIKYLNRLSDYLFVLARALNKREGIAEDRWQVKGRKG